MSHSSRLFAHRIAPPYLQYQFRKRGFHLSGQSALETLIVLNRKQVMSPRPASHAGPPQTPGGTCRIRRSWRRTTRNSPLVLDALVVGEIVPGIVCHIHIGCGHRFHQRNCPPRIAPLDSFSTQRNQRRRLRHKGMSRTGGQHCSIGGRTAVVWHRSADCLRTTVVTGVYAQSACRFAGLAVHWYGRGEGEHASGHVSRGLSTTWPTPFALSEGGTWPRTHTTRRTVG